jgi:hypothetical protein
MIFNTSNFKTNHDKGKYSQQTSKLSAGNTAKDYNNHEQDGPRMKSEKQI